MNKQEHAKQIQKAFFLSRDGAIVRCVSIIVDKGRKDLAKKVLETTNITKERFDELKAKNT